MSEWEEEFKKRTVLNLIVHGLETDGAHHKQWYLEQIAIRLGFDLDEVRKHEQANDYDWDAGLPRDA